MTDPAERLRQWLTIDGRYVDAHPMVDLLVDDALAQARAAGREEERERPGPLDIAGLISTIHALHPFGRRWQWWEGPREDVVEGDSGDFALVIAREYERWREEKVAILDAPRATAVAADRVDDGLGASQPAEEGS